MTLTLILSLISGIVPLFQKYIGSGLSNIIETGLSALSALIAGWVKGSPAADINASLMALQSVLTSLQQDASTDPADLPQIEELVKITEAAIQGYENAENGTDPSTLPIPPAV
jgi:hypothetical protein